MKKLNTALLLIGLAFLVYLVWKIGLGELWRQVSALGWGVALLILSEGLANLAHTEGWRRCIHGSYPAVPLLRLFRMAMAGFAINYLTPSASVGGEVSRATLLATVRNGPVAVSSVLLDKLMTAVAHLALAVLGSLFLLWRVRLPIELWAAMALITVLLTGGMVVFLLLQKHGKVGGVFRWMAEHKLGGRFLQMAAERMSAVDADLKRFYRERPRDLALSVWWHLLGHSAALLQAWLFLTWLEQPAPLATVAAAGFLSLWFDLMTFAIPLNLGTLEGSRIVVFNALGCPSLLGMAFGVAVRVAQVFWAVFGLISYSLLAARKPTTATKASQAQSSSPGIPHRQTPQENTRPTGVRCES